MTPRPQLCGAPIMPAAVVHVAKVHGAIPMHVIMQLAPSEHVTASQSSDPRQSIAHSASSPVQVASHSVLLRQSIAHSALVHVASHVAVSRQSTAQSLPAAQVTPHVAAVLPQSKSQLQPSHAKLQPAMGHVFAQQPEVQDAQLPTAQSAAQLQLFSPVAAQHVPLPHS
jgi:hypothetical protein